MLPAYFRLRLGNRQQTIHSFCVVNDFIKTCLGTGCQWKFVKIVKRCKNSSDSWIYNESKH